MDVEIIANTAELEALAPEWTRLWEACPGSTPFQAPQWQLPWMRHFGNGRLRTPVWRQNGNLIGILPLSIVESGDLPRRTAILNGTGISDYLDILVRPDQADGNTDFFEALKEIQPEWDLCDFQEIGPSSPLLRQKCPEGMIMERTPMQVCPVLTLPAAREELTPLMNHKHVKSLRRAHRLLRKAGEVRLEGIDRENLTEYLDSLFRLHGARWQERSEPGVLEDDAIRRFHRDVAGLMLIQGALRMYRLLLNGRTISIIYLFACGDRSFCYLAGFDPAAEHFSPGAVIMAHAVEESIAEGKREFDFLRGNEPYKYLWGAKDRINYRITIKKRF